MKKTVLFAAFITVQGCWQWVRAELYPTTQVQLQQSQYFSEPYDLENQDIHYSDIRIDFSQESQSGSFSTKFQFSALSGLKENSENHFLLPQAYVDYDLSQSLEITVGRKNFNWNSLDDEWKLGIWQPQFDADPLNIESQSLMGLSSTIDMDYAKLYLFVSPIHLPSQGAKVDTKDGKVVSSSRWFQNRISEIQIVSKNSELYFDLQEPAIGDVVNQLSMAGSILIGQEGSGWWLRSSYAYKPQNNFMIAYDPVTDLSVDGENKTFTQIHPVVYYHHVAAFDIGNTGENTKYWLSLAHETPELPELNPRYAYSALYESTYVSAKLSQQINLFSKKQNYVHLAYLNRIDNEAYASRDIHTENNELSVKRLKEALSVKLDTLIWSQSYDKLNAELAYVRSLTEKGDILSATVNYYYQQKWQWFLSVDALGIDESNDVGFISEYRGNDRVSGGFKYVF